MKILNNEQEIKDFAREFQLENNNDNDHVNATSYPLFLIKTTDGDKLVVGFGGSKKDLAQSLKGYLNKFDVSKIYMEGDKNSLSPKKDQEELGTQQAYEKEKTVDMTEPDETFKVSEMTIFDILNI